MFLSRSYPFGGSFTPEKNAVVQVNDDRGNTYTFEEKSNGKYIASDEFSASQNTNYTLNIQVDGTDGKIRVTAVATTIHHFYCWIQKRHQHLQRPILFTYILVQIMKHPQKR